MGKCKAKAREEEFFALPVAPDDYSPWDKRAGLSGVGIAGDDVLFCTDERGEVWQPVMWEGVEMRRIFDGMLGII